MFEKDEDYNSVDIDEVDESDLANDPEYANFLQAEEETGVYA